MISIHALHEESDACRVFTVNARRISIHALHEESDSPRVQCRYPSRFQSTLSMRRATTGNPYFDMVQLVFQSTLSMRRATGCGIVPTLIGIFQSTLSMRRATGDQIIILASLRISIHALHEESDFVVIPLPLAGYISIHALHEESDLRRTDVEQHRKISIHALHEESDRGH